MGPNTIAEGDEAIGRVPAARVPDWIESGAAVLDEAGRLVACNEPLRCWLGLGSSVDGGVLFWEVLRERCPAWSDAIARMAAGGDPFDSAEVHVAGGEGEPSSWYRLECVRGPGSIFVRLHSVVPPLAELAEAGWSEGLAGREARGQMFVRLLRAEAQFEQLACYWPGVIYSQRPDYSFQFISGRVLELTGHSAEDWAQRRARFWDVIHEADAGELQHQLARAPRWRQPVTNTFRLRNAVTGRVSYVLEHRRALLSRSGLLLGYEGVWLDVTRQTLAEKLLTSAAWKETLAVLTMGLAHDFSNVMAGIHSLSESFMSQLEEGHAFREGLGLIKKSSLQASQLVHRIVHLHLDKPGERNYHDLNHVVRELLELVRKVIPRRIEIAAEISPEPLAVYVDAFEFRQVIINLALNAADAMPERGRLVLHTRRVTAQPAGAGSSGGAVRFPCVAVSVEDNGSGIKPEHLEVIFDPFFTTKAGGKGSGLGLYNARLFAEKHNGTILVQSKPGEGSTFHVCLPEADFTEADRSTTAERRASDRRAVLVYGGATSLLDATVELLRTEGYHVATAHTLERAMEVLGASDYVYDAVLLIVESSGVVLAAHVAEWLRADPKLKVLIRPVGRDGDEMEPALARLADGILNPELSAPALLEKLRSVLESTRR